MNTTIIQIQPEDIAAPLCHRVLNFRPFLNYIKAIKEKTNSHKKFFFEYVIQQFEQHPGILEQASLEQMKEYEGLLELIYNSMSNMIEDEHANYWALSLPMQPTIFYSTNAFYTLLSQLTGDGFCRVIGTVQLEGSPIELVYSVLLEKYYNMPSFFSQNTVHAIEDKNSGLTRYYEACMDTRFIEIFPEQELPDFKFDVIQSGNYTKEEKLHMISEVLPLTMFRFEGFGITTIKDVSVKYAVENIKNYLLDQNFYSSDNYFTEVIHWLKIIMENNDIDFGLLPALYVNEKLVYNEKLYINSVLVNAARTKGMDEAQYLALLEKYFKNPKLVFFSEITEQDTEKHAFLKYLREDGIFSYALLPIYFGKSLVGVVEIFSKKAVTLSELMLAKLDPVVPLLSQLLKNGINDFNSGIERLIKEKFTSVQPSVQWKFHEVAWHYLRDKNIEGRNAELEEILFDDVFPLYGAIDIRNSTIERNRALYRDLQVHFKELIKMLEKLKAKSGFTLIDEKIFLAKKWLNEVSENETFTQQINLVEFLENNIAPFLANFIKGNPWAEKIAKEYYDAIDEETGIGYENRRLLENSMNRVIGAVNSYLDKMQEEIQAAYPSYFEKFRTDGVEYDIYIGQSIAPEKTFSDIFLKNLRLTQLQSMATIAKFTASMVSGLPVNVQTTQLIFIHSQPIDIKFRKDEKRFDVEGSYNIRYHVVKKRIDKVLVKDTDERLTQPDKIAMVYINPQDAQEYINYIEYLQGQNILCDDLEELELEELQGVNGLKALRVGVVKAPENPATKLQSPARERASSIE